MQLNTSGKDTLGSGISFIVIAIGAVSFRLYARIITKAGLAADDWLICISLLGYVTAFGVELWGGTLG